MEKVSTKDDGDEWDERMGQRETKDVRGEKKL